MLHLIIPGYKDITIKYLVLDYNGTLAKDGILLPRISEYIQNIHEKGIECFVITADTNLSVTTQCAHIPVEIFLTDKINATKDKLNLVEKLGKDFCIAIGNGRNDIEMLKASAIGICVLGEEGLYCKTAIEGDIVVPHIYNALELILHEHRLIATLRG